LSTINICYVMYYEKLCESRLKKPTTKTISPRIPLGLATTDGHVRYDIWDSNAIRDQVSCLF